MNKLIKNYRNELFGPMEEIFDDFYRDFFYSKNSIFDRLKASAGYPKMDITQSQGKFTILAAVPGVKAEDLNIEMLDDKTVKISGVMNNEYSEKSETSYITELSRKSFQRVVTLPESMSDPVSANLKDGMLTLVWDAPSVEDKTKKRLIPVVSSDN